MSGDYRWQKWIAKISENTYGTGQFLINSTLDTKLLQWVEQKCSIYARLFSKAMTWLISE
jgi:hypothetical protein